MIWLLTLPLVLLVVHLALELRQRGRHLAWVDLRDAEFTHLYQATMNLTLIPKDNPLSAFKQHGMLTKNAVRTEIVQALDVRLEAMDGATNAIVRTARSLATWEQTHPAPPLHWWQRQPESVKDPVVKVESPAAKAVKEITGPAR